MTEDPLARTELTFLLGMGFQLVLREFVTRMDAAGYQDLRPIHGAVFQALRRSGMTGTELADRLGVTKQAASQIVDELEDKQYVTRTPHPDGGRRKLIVLTDKAARHLTVAGRILHGLEAELAGHVDFAGLRGELTKLIRTMSGPDLPALRPVW
ncbi:MarR family winged helix-turn-helix transcriptional regulator [Kibdelosporangium phytohabitans]|uniref:MarR family winged helix-turn-helix transcriptional regulator n=1 Tax=Kibdelosporangium phytohabitans TaxID=860235 RepID=UPI001A09D79C|nr:MarR family transcriptional regulator [Kibdelosporangium phytohabitans]MBE1462369.1 DNA-binding MarR family transcriptional regulator [Kibdelosporangium phytohabitans]